MPDEGPSVNMPVNAPVIDTPLSIHPAPTGDPAGAANSDALLQASRRLDWRFLLPSPDLGRVVVVGAAPPSLVDALHLFASQVEFCTNSTPQGLYDLAVVHAPDDAALRQAVALICPGGWLYLETRRQLSRRLAALQGLGLEQTTAYWNWPSFEACTKIIPVDHLATVARFQTARLRPVWLRRFLGDQLAPRLARSRMLCDAIPCVSIVAQQPVARVV